MRCASCATVRSARSTGSTRCWTTFRKLGDKQLVADEMLYRELHDRFGDYFSGGMGAEALQKLVE